MLTTRPWVGEHYSDGVLGRRILLLGESNYGTCDNADGDCSDFVVESVTEGVITGSVAFFTKVAKLVLMATGRTKADYPRSEIQNFWQHVAFTNYVQRLLQRSGQRPTP